MLSTKPKILTPSLSNILIPLLTSRRATSWGVETIIAPSILISWENVNCVSPVPGGISTIIKSKSFQETFWVKVLIALVTIGPRQIIGVCWSAKNPIDIHWILYFKIGSNFWPSLFGFSFISNILGTDGP